MAGAVATATGGLAAQEPVIWWVLGYPFPAGPLVVCICAVVITRVIIGLQAHGKGQWTLDVAISALCLLVTILWVQAHDLGLLMAGISGIGIGALGAGIIGLAKGAVGSQVRAGFKAFIDAFRAPPAG